MPELPEVETIRAQLAREIVGKKLKGTKVVGVSCRAKLLMIDLADGSSLVFNDQRKFGWFKKVKNTKEYDYFSSRTRYL